jgi:hypothetical protein
MPTVFPANILPSEVTFGLRSNTQVFRSPLTASIQTLRMPGAAWAGRATFNDLQDAEARELEAFLVDLDGMNGRFYFGDYSLVEPRGAISGHTNSLQVRGASQTGSTLAVDNGPANLSNAFLAGDYVAFDTSMGRELKMVTAAANFNSSGQTTLSVAPNIRTSPSDNAAVAYRLNSATSVGNSDTTCVMRLQSDESQWSVRAPVITGITISFIEAFG